MGQEQHKFTNDQPSPVKKQKKLMPNDYRACYEKWLGDPDYLYNLMTENRALIANILQFFANARNSYEDFLEMVIFLRNYDPYNLRNDYAIYNAQHTTILDRFFMLMVKLPKYEMLDYIKLNQQQMQNLFIELMKLFMPEPRKGFMLKVKKFIGLKEVETISLKEYSASLRQYFPHIQKHIKDYYTMKFRDMIQDAHLLRHFKSQILHEDAVILSMKVSQLTSPSIKLLFEPRTCGMSFASIQRNLVGYTGPWLLIVEHMQKDNEGHKKIYKFGAYQNGPIRDVATYQGDSTGFLFELQPKLRHYGTGHGNGGTHYFLLSNNKDGKSRKGLGFGGNEDKQNFKLWIDQDIDKSTVYNGIDQTYGFGALLNPSTTNLSIARLQIWGLGTEEDYENQQNYWAQRGAEIQKRRKVNKAEFLNDAGTMFQNTFSHRDQVYGVIERTQQKQYEGPNQLKQKIEQQSHIEKQQQQYNQRKKSQQIQKPPPPKKIEQPKQQQRYQPPSQYGTYQQSKNVQKEDNQ